MATKAVTTKAAKRKMLLARAGRQSLPRITKMAFGNGGVNDAGEVKEIDEESENLANEILRKDIDRNEIISDTQIKYFCTLAENELVGEELSEIALVDSDGDLVAIKNFMKKGKDEDWEMEFAVTDTM